MALILHVCHSGDDRRNGAIWLWEMPHQKGDSAPDATPAEPLSDARREAHAIESRFRYARARHVLLRDRLWCGLPAQRPALHLLALRSSGGCRPMCSPTCSNVAISAAIDREK